MNCAFASGVAVRPFACTGETAKMIRVPLTCACGSHFVISAWPAIFVGAAGSQLIEMRFSFRPTSPSVAKNVAPLPALPASSVTPTSMPAPATPAPASTAQAHTSRTHVLVVFKSVPPRCGPSLASHLLRRPSASSLVGTCREDGVQQRAGAEAYRVVCGQAGSRLGLRDRRACLLLIEVGGVEREAGDARPPERQGDAVVQVDQLREARQR